MGQPAPSPPFGYVFFFIFLPIEESMQANDRGKASGGAGQVGRRCQMLGKSPAKLPLNAAERFRAE